MKLPNPLCGTLAMAGWLATGAAQAQAALAVFGLIDVGVLVVDPASAPGKRLVRMPSLTDELPSWLGFRGNDLGGGYTANVVLELGFAPDQGGLTARGCLAGSRWWP